MESTLGCEKQKRYLGEVGLRGATTASIPGNNSNRLRTKSRENPKNCRQIIVSDTENPSS
jgi:hypothetical protein